MWLLISLGPNLAFMAYVATIGWIEVNAIQSKGNIIGGTKKIL